MPQKYIASKAPTNEGIMGKIIAQIGKRMVGKSIHKPAPASDRRKVFADPMLEPIFVAQKSLKQTRMDN